MQIAEVEAYETDDSTCFDYGVDYEGFDLATTPSYKITNTAAPCQAWCQAEPGCTHFTWRSPRYDLEFDRSPQLNGTSGGGVYHSRLPSCREIRCTPPPPAHTVAIQ